MSKVCIFDQRSVKDIKASIDFRCSKSLPKHRHYQRRKVDQFVEEHAMRYIGKHKKIAVWTDGRVLKTTHSRFLDNRGQIESTPEKILGYVTTQLR